MSAVVFGGFITTRIILIASFLVVVSSAGFLESLLLSWDLPTTESRSARSNDFQQRFPQDNNKKCLCQSSGCLCCVDLNLTTSIDLEGPVCAQIKQKQDNVTLNISYEDNPIHNATIKIVDAGNKPTCMNLLSDLAQICARFTSMTKSSSNSGHDGCLVIQPALLGTAQATYHVGCFNFLNQTVRQLESIDPTKQVTSSPIVEEDDDDDDEELNAQELIAAVSASAERGLALFSQWLGLNFNPKQNNATTTEEEKQQQQQQQQQPARQSRQMKDDERLKELLSAQDNVVRGSAVIGHPNNVQTTFVYSEQQGKPQAGQLTLVPRESRRGGRAYNIHQHVNEI